MSEQAAIDVSEREIITTRVLKAPGERVFKAWTDPAILARWWGPKGFSNIFHTFDLRPGGIWDFTMHGPDGKDYPNTCVFRDITVPSRLEFDHLKEMHFYKAVVTFTMVDGATRIDWSMRFNTPEELRPIRNFVARANEENLDKLEAELNEDPNEP